MLVKQVCIVCALLVFELSGCGTSSVLDGPVRVREVQILGSGQIAPLKLYAYVGEEVRWRNLLEVPVQIGFLNTKVMGNPVCEVGIITWLGSVDDLVTVDPGEYVSLCPGRAGTIRYNVWTDISDPFHSMSQTAFIYFEDAT